MPLILVFPPLPAVLCACLSEHDGRQVSASLRENAFALSHYPSLITRHCFATSREVLRYAPYLQLPTGNDKEPPLQLLKQYDAGLIGCTVSGYFSVIASWFAQRYEGGILCKRSSLSGSNTARPSSCSLLFVANANEHGLKISVVYLISLVLR